MPRQGIVDIVSLASRYIPHFCLPTRHGTAHLARLDYNSILLFPYAALQLTLAPHWFTYVFYND